jgi:DNA polymerase III alpha subunit
LAGVITSIRTINTKKGDQMAFVQLEDLQGGCEVVFFPKAYAEYKEKLAVDAVVIVKGKAQTREARRRCSPTSCRPIRQDRGRRRCVAAAGPALCRAAHGERCGCRQR